MKEKEELTAGNLQLHVWNKAMTQAMKEQVSGEIDISVVSRRRLSHHLRHVAMRLPPR